MVPTIEVKGLGALVGHRRALAERVIAEFGVTPPRRRLLIYLDNSDRQNLRDDLGAANRGVYFPVCRANVRAMPLEVYVQLEERSVGGVTSFAFDDAIYIHGSTCENNTGLAMTLAHELQHFVQHAFQLRMWAANCLITMLSRQTIKELALSWADIPTEHEARIVGKRVAERVCGPARVRDLIARHIAEAADAGDWAFIGKIETSRGINLEFETRRLYQRIGDYRHEVMEVWNKVRNELDFMNVDPAELFGGLAAAAGA